MGYWIDKDTYQFDNEREMMIALGLDPDTMEGDYAESYHHMSKMWGNVTVDNKFDCNQEEETNE